MSRTFQVDGNPIAVRLQQPGTTGDKRQIAPYHAQCDQAGREAMVTGFGEAITGEKHPDISVVFNYGINPEFAVTELTGTGAAGENASRLALSATGGAGTAIIYSKRFIVYRMGHEAIATFTCAFDQGKTGITQKAGLFDDLDGYFISLDENNRLQANHRVGGVTTTVNQLNFNLDTLDGSGVSNFTLDPQALSIWRISYGYHGILPAVFEVYGGTMLGWIPFHVFDLTNTQNDLALQSPNTRIRMEVTSDGTNDVTIYSGSWMGSTIGATRDRALNDQFGFAVSTSIVAGVETVIGSMRVKSTFQGKANKIPVDFHNLTGGLDGTKTHIVRIYKNTPLTGAVWTDIIGANSVIEIDLTGTLTGTSPDELKYAAGTGKQGEVDHEFKTGELRLVAGDSLTFTVLSANISDVVLAGQWDELK